jgi:TonB-linked outer membrane protein, SusC/RagA family
MNSKDRIAVSKEIESKGLAYNFIPAAVGYEGLLYDLYDRKITYDQFLEDVSILETNNTDWFDLLYSNALSHKHNISISGANDIVNYYLSGGYTSNKSNLNNTGVEKYNALMKFNIKMAKNLTGTFQLRGSFLTKDYLHSSIAPYEYAYNTSRAIPAFNPDNSYVYYTKEEGFKNEILGYNILNEIENSDRTVNTSQYAINANLEWKIMTGLRLTGTLGLNNSSTNDREWYSERTFAAASLRRLSYGTPLPTDIIWREEQCSLPYGGALKNTDTRNFGYTGRVQIDYNRTFADKHNITLVGGSEIRSTQYKGLKSTSFGYLPDRGETFVAIDPAQWPKYKEMLLNNPNVVTNRLSNFVSLYGIATYAYKSKYIFNLNIRADGSNKFGQDKKARFLPIWSVSARWNINEEKLFRDISWLNNLSIKGSYGIQGNVSDDQTPKLIMQLGSLDQLSGEYMSTLSKLPNPYLKWEKTNAYNIALDWALFNNRLSGTVEYYYKRGKDQIVSYEVPATTGSTYMSLNMGDVMNKGYELIINATPIKNKDFSWTISLNGAKNVNRVTRGGLESEYTYSQYTSGRAVLEGYALNSMFSYQFAGLDNNGLPTFKNTEEKDGITRKEMLNNVFVYSGNRIPDIEGGLSNRLNYKNFSLGFFFSYSLGSKVRINNLYSNSGQRLPRPDQNMSNEFVNRWQKPGDENITNIPALSTEQLDMSSGSFTKRKISIADNGWQMYNNSDIRVASGNYLKLRSVNLRYNFGSSVCSKLRVNSANISLEAYNLFTIASKKLNGQDPEQVSFGGLGATTPPISSFSMVLNLTF